jgi:hypothetical protein
VVALSMLDAAPVSAKGPLATNGVSAVGPIALTMRGRKKKKRRRRKKEVFTPQMAAEERAQAHKVADPLRDNGELKAAGIAFDAAASKRGDPILFLDAGDAYLALAKKDQDTEAAETAAERGAIALDILYYQLDDASDDDFRVVEGTEVPALITRAEDLQSSARALIDEIEQQRAAAALAAQEPDDKKKRGKMDPAKALTIGGAVSTTVGGILLGVGVAGLGLGAARQQEAEDPTVYGPEYDAVAAKGKRANLLAYVGLSGGAVFLAAGIAMLVIGNKRKKKGGKAEPDEEETVWRLSPSLGPQNAGLSLSGRF